MYSAAQLAHEQFVWPTSMLVGKTIDQITLKLRKNGASAGRAQVGIFNHDLTVKKQFGTKEVTTISSIYADDVFFLTGTDVYTIQPGDRVGITFAGDDADDFIPLILDRDAADPFDGANT